MSDTKHTPGPWGINPDPCHFGSATSIVGGDWKEDGPLARELMVEVGGFAGIKTTEANTRLIAAAPDMLEALEAVVRAANEGPEHLYMEVMASSICRDALVKAKGGTQ